jgi:hypothetical protein
MPLSDDVIALVFLGVGLFLMAKLLTKPGMKYSEPKDWKSSPAPTSSFSNPRWNNRSYHDQWTD